MSYKSYVHIVLYGFFLCSCVAQTANSNLGTLQGSIGIFEGNCMPSPGVEPCKPEPISTTVYITSLSEKFQMELTEDSITTNDKGEFEINLPIGNYSLFLKDGADIICDGYQCEKECFCTPFKISLDSTTIINANIDHASW